jgi:hypothetical protein
MTWERMQEIIKTTLMADEYDAISGCDELAKLCVDAIRAEGGIEFEYEPEPLPDHLKPKLADCPELRDAVLNRTPFFEMLKRKRR